MIAIAISCMLFLISYISCNHNFITLEEKIIILDNGVKLMIIHKLNFTRFRLRLKLQEDFVTYGEKIS